MARAHASGIKVRDAAAAAHPGAEPKVVVAVETDPRKVPTLKRLIPGRREGEERAALLPPSNDGSASVSRHARAREAVRHGRSGPSPSGRSADARHAAPVEDAKLPRWMRASFVAVFLLLFAGVARQARLRLAPAPASRPSAVIPIPIPAPTPPVMMGETRKPPTPPAPIESAPAAVATDPIDEENVASTPALRPVLRAESPRPRVRAQVTKPAYVPPFQLPGEKP